MHTILIALLAIASLMAGCTKKEEKPKEIVEMEERIQKLEADLATYDDKIKKAVGNPGLEIKLTQDKDLAKARADRMKKQYEQKTGTSFAPPPKAEEGGGHH